MGAIALALAGIALASWVIFKLATRPEKPLDLGSDKRQEARKRALAFYKGKFYPGDVVGDGVWIENTYWEFLIYNSSPKIANRTIKVYRHGMISTGH